ncbi:piRNA biogenesis protein EXD1-like [Asterias rubens]|uniref:piRNA biogenesis protein EXD1-like n=1 Tax=Asterias rubens TaxID=7604 RepID=UPI0014556A59|nr:piRNA biogenesis protein EXD1-like [Asterias rubens]
MAAAPSSKDAVRRREGNTPSDIPHLEYQLIDKHSQIKPVLDEIRRSQDTSPFLAVDLEGESLSRKGELSIVSIATDDDIYLFDIKKLGREVFDKGLKSILEDSSRDKIMFDCRQDADCLWHQFRVRLANVLDLQLMEIIHNEEHPDPEYPQKDKIPRVGGFLYCLKRYVHDDALIDAKEAGKDIMLEAGIWMIRPMKEVLLQYSACDVRGFFQLYSQLEDGLGPHDMKRLRIASKVYLDLKRERKTRSYDEYESNRYLPMYVIPAKGSLRLPFCDTQCFSCKRDFPRSDFKRYHLRNGTQKCAVCINRKWTHMRIGSFASRLAMPQLPRGLV